MSGTDNFEAVVKERRTEAVAEFHEDKTLIKRFQHALHVSPALVPLLVLLVSIVLFAGLVGSRFFSAATLTLILQQVQLVGIVAAAQTLVILTAGIDLSVGAIAVLSSVVMGQFAFRYGLPVPLAILCGLGVGTILGYLNGWLVAVMKLPPFIVTLGTWQIILASNFLYSKNETIRAQDIEANAPLLQFFANTFKIGADESGRGGATFTFGVIFMLLLIAVLAYALRSTAWGRHVYAVGDDPDAAQLSGVNVKRTLISVYALSGLICAFAGWALIGRIGSVSPTSGAELNIQSITAVVIGGISLFGGRGSIWGALFGALIVGVFSLGLRLLGVDPQWTFFFIGVLIIVAVAVDQWIRKVAA
ncbi:ABC transporter permease [Rubellimicrobium roseum]|uniref:ABC transporter permease n=1 Tax=Rubellimicrobium roseum TaxID=687525 RepID=A0A5C4N7S2_9RHOB|nr:ABC transporter permease [Rubellimicrobium roseum]TNC69127.1 ABC transporter permease [Rubellimicrobium roseum]